jgi:branched-chain amino acid transport system ATP-binding protein
MSGHEAQMGMSLLRVQGLCKSFGAVQAVQGVEFELMGGELLAIIGPNGAGKSTTFNMLHGQLRADQGSILLQGVELVGRKPSEIWRLGVGRTFQIAATFASLSVVQNVQMVLLSLDRKIYTFWSQARDYKRDQALQLLVAVGMIEHADRLCNALSYADIKRLELAMALAHGPKLLLMDEPTAGMPPHERGELMALVKRLVREQGLAVVFTEHSMDLVFSNADRVLVMAQGQVVAQGRAQEIANHTGVQNLYLGSQVFNSDCVL